MSYTYNPSDPVTVLNPAEPSDSDIVGSTVDEALRQIKAYLLDPTVGPDARYRSLKTSFDTIVANVGGSQALPVGVIGHFACALPSGWLECNGQAVSRTTYEALFNLVGVTFGIGDGTTTFNLPDCRSRVMAGADPTLASNSAALFNAKFGAETHTVTSAENGTHTHKFQQAGANLIVDAGSVSAPGNVVAIGYYGAGANTVGTFAGTWDAAGGNTAHNNIMPSLTFKFGIRA